MSLKNAAETETMRDTGKGLPEKGFFELDLMSSKIMWMNEFSLTKLGMNLEQAQSMTVYDVVPEEFHDSLSSFISDASSGRTSKFYIWPFRSSDMSVTWWYFARFKSDHPTHWFKAEFLNKTGKSGPEYSSMLAAMNTANSYNDLYNKLSDFQLFTKSNIDSINEKVQELKDEQAVLKEQIVGATSAANRAANAAIDVSSAMRNFKTDVQEQFSKQTVEILRLISTDAVHDQRLVAFEKHIQKTTDNAVRVITVQADKAGQIITTQADKAGKSLSRKVTIPIGAIAAVMTILQWIITHWPK